jgi:hypothetical protein
MSVPVPQLDDRDFQSLVAEAEALIRRRAPQWTDLSESDPGVVLLELFAHLTDLMLYRLNRVPEKAYIEFLRLIGLTLQPPAAATVDLHFTRRQQAAGAIAIPAGTHVTAARGAGGGQPAVFATVADAEIADGQDGVDVLARHAERVQAEPIGTGTGLPGQSCTTARSPIVAPVAEGVDLVIGVSTTEQLESRVPAIEYGGVTYRIWSEVDSFINRAPDDTVYVVDRMAGTITFAPAIRLPGDDGTLADAPAAMAAVPPAGSDIRAWYWVGGGRDGNVVAGILTVLRDTLPGVASVTNPAPATGGRAAESVANALVRGPQQLHAIERAMTAEDYEAVARRASRGVARAKAYSQASVWRHAVPGTVEVLLVPYVPGQDDGTGGALTLEDLLAHQTEVARAQVEQEIDQRRPLGTRRAVKWARYKRVWARLRVVVRAEEDRDAVQQRVATRLNGTINPLPTPVSPSGWQFGQALRASDVYDIVLKEPGVRFADQMALIVESAPAPAAKTVAADCFQAQTWYAGAGSTVYRSLNAGASWEAMISFDGETIDAVRPHHAVPGLVAVSSTVPGGARLHLSFDAGESWDPFELRKPEFDVSDIAWVDGRDAPSLLLATNVGLFELKAVEDATVVQISVSATTAKGFYAVATATDALGVSQVAIAARDSGGVFLSAQGGAPNTFREAKGLKGQDVRVLRVQREAEGTRAWVWAGAAAAGEADPGNGAARWELRGDQDPPDGWVRFATNWDAGGCWDLAFLGTQVFAASYRGGVLTLDSSRSDAAWSARDVNNGLPLRGPGTFLFLQVDAIGADASSGLVMCAGPNGVYATSDQGQRYVSVSQTEFSEAVELPSTWLFVSGQHEITVESEAGA